MYNKRKMFFNDKFINIDSASTSELAEDLEVCKSRLYDGICSVYDLARIKELQDIINNRECKE